MSDFSFGDDRPQRKHHGDVLLEVESVDLEARSVSGTEVHTGEAFTISLATPQEFAKHFVSSQDHHRPFEERVASAEKRFENRPALVPGGDEVKTLKVEVGSVVSLENSRTFQTPEGEEKTAAGWPKSVVRDPAQEAVLTGTVQATHYDTKAGQRIDVTVVKEQEAQNITDFDLEGAFTGQWDDVPLTQTGVVVAIRNQRGETTTANLTTPYRKYDPEPSLEAALDAPQGSYQIFAAAVIAAKTDTRDFDDLKINERVSPQKAEIARKIYDAVAANPDNPPFEITVMPMAKTQFIPGDSLKNFMRDYHGTRNGKPSEDQKPDPAASYQGKGFVPSVVALSRDPKGPDVSPASARTVFPENKFSFKEIGQQAETPARKLREIGVEATVKVHGETFGANAGGPTPDAKPEAPVRKKSFDTAPSL
ncbi:hypothetical protein [uncultured Tateyamaria sp.]|uniref:hypothetical protein n=1 Tax=uncultured Tateyamaria sp. TaxID=455651 RepID=UPI00263111A8|nr:hypothetical protein [uncultured Tateyamaria sp.]